MVYRQKARNVGHPGCHKQLPVGDGWNSTLLWWFWGRCIIGFSNLHATYFINIQPAEMNIQLIQPTSSMFPKYTSQPTMPLKPSSAQKNHENKSWIERCSLGYGSTSWPKVVSVRHVQQICGFPCSMTMTILILQLERIRRLHCVLWTGWCRDSLFLSGELPILDHHNKPHETRWFTAIAFCWKDWT